MAYDIYFSWQIFLKNVRTPIVPSKYLTTIKISVKQHKFMVFGFEMDWRWNTYIVADSWSAVLWRVPRGFWLSIAARYTRLSKLWPVEIMRESIMTDRNNKLFHFEPCSIQRHLVCKLSWIASICVSICYLPTKMYERFHTMHLSKKDFHINGWELQWLQTCLQYYNTKCGHNHFYILACFWLINDPFCFFAGEPMLTLPDLFTNCYASDTQYF